MLRAEQDAYGAELKACMEAGNTIEIVQRDDGYLDAYTAYLYFSPVEEWPELEQQAIKLAHGRVLDVGCGAGRVALYLQTKGQEVVSIDNSPGAIEVCRARGVRDVRLMSITQINSSVGFFDSVVMFGNNFGLFGSYTRARWLLRRLKSMTSAKARIIAETNDPYATDNPDHLSYHERNRGRGRMGGQLRIRVRYRKVIGPWFDYLLVSQDELRDMLDGTGWRLAEVLESDGPGYIAVMERA